MRIVSVVAAPLSIPLRDPFIIASARIDVTRAALVSVQLADASGQIALGHGEAAALPPVTRDDQPQLLAAIATAASALQGSELERFDELAALLDERLGACPPARAGVECAVLDAWARLARAAVCSLISGRAPRPLVTDITLPIAGAERTAQLAAAYRADGFRIFKLKVGANLDDDVRVLRAVQQAVSDAVFRLDANGGFDAGQALQLLAAARAAGVALECFEQPCARADHDGMARVVREGGGVPGIADESVRDLADLERVIASAAANGVNLKLVKSGGLLAARAIGERARAAGLSVMCGGMVETRLGMTAMAHVACALAEVEYIDLDTAFLLQSDPFEGGYREQGPTLTIAPAPGLDIRVKPPG
jgi:L-alanine-DL-glutamate epimerase-like enolase superfamily enzyme